MPERFKVVCIPCKVLYKCSALPLCVVVVSLRQLERQLEREKERSSTELTATHAVHRDEVEKLTKQLQTLHADNNLLMVCCHCFLQLHIIILQGDHENGLLLKDCD